MRQGWRHEKAEQWHRTMMEQGVPPNAHSYSAVISACAKAGDVEAATRHLEEMNEVGVPADVVVYSGVLDACAKVLDTKTALSVFKQMKAAGVRPNVVTYASMAKPFAHQGEWQQVERLAKDMEKSGLRVNEYFLYAQLISYANAQPRQIERAELAFRKAVDNGVNTNRHVVGALARVVGRKRSHELVQGCTEGSR